MQNWETFIGLLAFIIIELVLFHAFYSRRAGKKAVYTAWYAWIIDTLAMFSGVTIMGLSLFCIYNPWIFQFPVPQSIFILLFVFGSWQFGIHLVKWIIRATRNQIEKRKKKKDFETMSRDEFEKIYGTEVKTYFQDVADDGKVNNSNKSTKNSNENKKS